MANTIGKITNEEQCTGCGACHFVCPVHAIEMKEDGLGFIRPRISEKCIKCGLCIKTCPANNLEISQFSEPKKTYAAKSINRLKTSTSGGIGALLYEWAIKKRGGIGYGVSFDNSSQSFSFSRVSKTEEIAKVSGSKYVQCPPHRIYSMVKSDLERGSLVLVVGTPCQISGFASALNREKYKNLYLVDIICHGTPSGKMLSDYFKDKGINGISNVTFRSGKKYIFKALGRAEENRVLIEERPIDNPYLEGFQNGSTIRECCHGCKYANCKRVGDLTLGDFWGLDHATSLFSNNDNISLIFENTEKGKTILDELSAFVIIEERSLEEAKNGNTQLNHPVLKNQQASKFAKYYNSGHGFSKSIKKSRSLRNKIKNIAPIKTFIKWIKP